MPKDFLAQYDVALSWSSTNLGLMLKEENALKRYLSYYAPPLGQSIQTGEASDANFPPEQELILAQHEFHAGMGSLNFANKRYAYSNGIDGRTRSALKLSPKENTATISLRAALATASFTNMDFETWSDATTLGTWTKSTGSTTNREGTQVQGGTYSCCFVPFQTAITDSGFEIWTDGTHLTNWTIDVGSITQNGVGPYSCVLDANTAAEIHQDITWNNILQSAAVSFGAELFSNGADTLRVGINDGVTTTYSSYVAGDSAFHTTTVNKTLAANATRLRVIVQRANNANTAVVDTSTLTSAPVAASLYQDLSTWADYYENKSATFTLYTKTSLANNLRIGISDGVDTTYGDYHTGGGNFENLTVTRTIASNATQLRLVIQRNSTTYATTDYLDTGGFSQAQAARGNPLSPQCFIRFGAGYYYLENKTIFSLSATTFTEAYTFEDAITGVEVYGANMYVSVGVDDYYYYTANGTAWTRTSTAAYKMIQLRAIGSSLYGGDTTSSFKTATDPVTGAWGSSTTVGNTSSSITDLADYNETAFIGKSDGLYYLDASGDPQSIAPDFKGLNSTNNCLGMKVWGGALWIPLNNGLYRYSFPTYHDLTNVSPSLLASYFTDYHGRIHALAGDTDWLYIAGSSSTATSSKTPIMAGRYETLSDVEVDTDVRLHTLLNVDLDNVYAMDVYSTKLWIAGLKSTTAYIRYLSLADDDYPTSGTFTFVTSYYDSNFPSFYKSYHSFELQSENLTTNITVKVEFSLDGGTWTELTGSGSGSFTSSTAPQVKYFQANTYARKIRFRFTMTTNSASTTPKITGFIVRGALRPDTLRVQEWWVDASDYVIEKDGQQSSGVGSQLLSSLNTAKSQVWALTIYDPWGTAMRGFIKSPTPYIEGYEIDAEGHINGTIKIILQEAKLAA